jgi:UDP-glucose 4-epimerase
MQDVVVTGGCGYIGTELVLELNDYCNVTVIDKRAPKKPIKGVRYIREEIGGSHCNDTMLFGFLEGADTVYHLAADPRIQATIDMPSKAFYSNCLATHHVLDAVKHLNTPRLIFSSTSSVYGNITEAGYRSTESDTRQYLNPYALSKGTSEDWCYLYSQMYGVNIVVLRYFNVYGGEEDVSNPYAMVVGKFLDQFKLGKALTVNGDGSQTRDFTFISDIIAGTVSAGNVDNEDAVGEVINLGTGTSYSIKQLAQAISGKVIYGPAIPGEAMHTRADNRKAFELLGWEPTVDILEWVKHEA